MPRPPDPGALAEHDWQRLEELADRFTAAWEEAPPADLAAFLPDASDPLRRAALQELIQTELEIRWRRGRGRGLEAYLEQFPELGPASGLPAALVYEEYRVRRLHGDRPELADYQRRFPAQWPE